MSLKSAQNLEKEFLSGLEKIKEKDTATPVEGGVLKSDLANLLKAQIKSRIGDIVARELRAKGLGFYTISSAGHENNSAVASHLKKSDPALLHYRSGSFMMLRSQYNDLCPLKQLIWSLMALKDEAVSGGRHKVWGDNENWVIPQTSTIASHLPKSVGMAFAIERKRALKGNQIDKKENPIVVASFGDASANHASAQAAFNTADWLSFQNLSLPLLFLCEDNGIGISVKSPKGFIRKRLNSYSNIKYFEVSSLDLEEAYKVAGEAVKYCREKRRPAFLHLKTIRLLGHAGSDMESAYRSAQEIDLDIKKDPLLKNSELIVNKGILSADQIIDIWNFWREKAREYIKECTDKKRIESKEDVMKALVAKRLDSSHYLNYEMAKKVDRVRIFKGEKLLPENQGKRQMSMLLNQALHDEMLKDEKILIFGEDVAKKGGVYGITRGLTKTFGLKRVFNTLLDETSILGLAIGASQMGFLSCPEMQYLAYYQNAQDQIRSEAASQSFFSNGFWTNPMVIRIASFAYQKGFGGHFHNDNSIAALRDLPGVMIAAPARGDDAVKMLRTCFELARKEKRVVFFLEPIALYNQKDLYEEGDKKWSFNYPTGKEAIIPGDGRVYFKENKDILIITYSNGSYLSLKAAKKAYQDFGIKIKILDLRWLLPLNKEQILSEAKGISKVLVVDECRITGNVNEEILSLFAEKDPPKVISRICAENSYLPLGPATDLILPTEEKIYKAIKELNEKDN